MLIPFIVNENFWNHSIWGMAMRGGIERELKRKRYEFVYFVGSKTPEEDFGQIIFDQYFEHGAPRLVVVIGTSKVWVSQIYHYFKKLDIEILLVCNRPPEHVLPRGTIKNDYYSGIDLLLRHFRACGCKKTALYGYFPDSVTDEAKLNAYYELADSHAVFINNDNLDDCYNQFIARINEFDSVLCVNDIAALSLVNHFRKDGISVPDQIQVGCFSSSRIPEMYTPSITSIVMAYKIIGQQAVVSYSHLTHCDPNVRMNIDVAGKLIVRDSTKSFDVSDSATVQTGQPINSHPQKFNFFDDSEVTAFSGANRLIEYCDQYDYEIISRYLANQPTVQIAEEMAFSPETIRYRIRCLAGVLGYKSATELIEYIKCNPFSAVIWNI